MDQNLILDLWLCMLHLVPSSHPVFSLQKYFKMGPEWSYFHPKKKMAKKYMGFPVKFSPQNKSEFFGPLTTWWLEGAPPPFCIVWGMGGFLKPTGLDPTWL